MASRGEALVIDAAPADAFQRYVKQVVVGERDWPRASGGDGAAIEAERRRLARELLDGAELVDLVGHSTPRSCLLVLGDWVLTEAEAERLASYLPKSVKVVRLIGCYTARTPEGVAAASALARHGLEAHGTLHRVYTTHFDERGVKLGAAGPPLVAFYPDGRGPIRGGGEARRGAARRLLAWLRRGAAWAIARLAAVALRRLPPRARIARLLHAEAEAMPGLLTEPLLALEIAAGGEAWTLEILFDFEYARLYPSAGPAAARDLVYAIRGARWGARWGVKTPLERYLEGAPRGVAVIARHAEAADRCPRVPAR